MSRDRKQSAHDRSLVISSDRVLTLPEFAGWSRQASSVIVHSDTLHRMDAAHLATKTSTRGPIYGVSTGFGPMVTTAVEAADCTAMQYNLVRSHAAGLGGPVPQHIVRGMLLARLQSLTRNHSAVPGALASRLADLLSLDLLPVVPRKGGVGASGDLVQLAHLALTVIGDGTCTLRGELLGAGEPTSGSGSVHTS